VKHDVIDEVPHPSVVDGNCRKLLGNAPDAASCKGTVSEPVHVPVL
jgi:hypothetical protein